jgi:hypothetical protein
MKRTLNQKELQAAFQYNPETGELYRKDKPNKKPITSPYIQFKGMQYTTAQVIWCYMTGQNPPCVMRIDKDPRNRKWSNYTTGGMQRRRQLTGNFNERYFDYDPRTDTLLWVLSEPPTEIHGATITLRGQTYTRDQIIGAVMDLKVNRRSEGY